MHNLNKSDVKEDNSRSITVSNHALAPQLKIYRLYVVVGPTLDQTLNNGCWANVSTPTMTCCQQLQPLPNVGPTTANIRSFIQIDSGYSIQFNSVH